VAAGQVQTAELVDGDNQVKGKLTNGKTYDAKYPAEYADELTTELKAAAPRGCATTRRPSTTTSG